MIVSKRLWLNYVALATLGASGLLLLASCAPIEPMPTLNEARTGSARERTRENISLNPGEISAEVIEIDRSRQDLRVSRDDGRRVALLYDRNTLVTYNGWQYKMDDLEVGDRIAYRPLPRDSRYVDTIRIREPVQARSGPGMARTAPPPRRSDIVEGTVERIDLDIGVFDIRPSAGRNVTVSIPYNARAADVESFRSLRRGDRVRVEGEFVNPESFQLLAFLSPR